MECMGYYHETKQVILKRLLTGSKIEIGYIGDAVEVQRDIELGEVRKIAICGKLYNQNHQPVCGEMIRILKKSYKEKKEILEVVACTKTNTTGEYSVVACGRENERFYVVVEGLKCTQARDYKKTTKNLYCQECRNQNSSINYSQNTGYKYCNKNVYLSGRPISAYAKF